MKSFLIIGMGTFGHHVCRCLSKFKCEIMVADNNAENVEDVLDIVVSAKIGNCTNIEVLRSFDVDKFDACFVCIGGNFQASLEITDLLKELGAKTVYSKAETDIQAKFMRRNGADHIVFPEKDAAMRIATAESSDDIFDFVSVSSEYAIFEITCFPPWHGKSIIELNFRAEYGLNILGIKKNPGGFVANPKADYVFEPTDHLMVFGTAQEVAHLEEIMRKK